MKTNQASMADGRPHMEIIPFGQVLFGRFTLPDRSEHACRVVGVSIAGAEILCPFVPKPGVAVTISLEHFGRIEGVAGEKTADGFKLEFSLAGAARERFLSRQAWLISKQSGGVQDDRQYNRRQLHGAHSLVILTDGRQFPCEIIDVSLTGAGVSCDVMPAIGSKVYLGKMLGSVVRYIENGFAIEFLTAFGSDFLADIIVDEPHRPR